MNDRDFLDKAFTARRVGLGLAVLLLCAYFPVIFGGQTFYYRDFGVLSVPTAFYQREAFWRGEIPLWNPYSNCGAPFLAQWGTMVLYPFSLLYVLLPFPWSLNLFCIFHLWLGGLGMFFLARKWAGQETPAAVAVVAFVFNGITQASLTWPNYVAALGLLPWVMFLVEEAWNSPFNRREAGPVVLASLAAAMQLLTGVPELALFTWSLLAVFWVQRLALNPRQGASLLAKQLAIVMITTGLIAAQILPFVELLQHSHRAPGFAGDKWALPPWGWANFILPRFNTFRTPEGTAFQLGQEFLTSTYLGAPVCFLALLGCSRRAARVRILAVLALIFAVLALGSSGYLYPVLTRMFPFLGIARYPVKFLLPLAVIVPLLGACGVRVLLSASAKSKVRWLVLGLAGTSVLLGFLLWFNHAYPMRYNRWPEVWQNGLIRWAIALGCFAALYFMTRALPRLKFGGLTALILFIVVDGKTHLPNLNPTTASTVFAPGLWSEAQKMPNPELGKGRVFITVAAEERLLHSIVGDAQKDLIGKRLALWSHLNLLDVAPKVNGSSTLQVREQADVQKYLYAATNRNISSWLDFLNATLQTATNSVVEWQERPSAMPFVTAGQASARVEFGGTNAISHWPPEFDFKKQVALEDPMGGATPELKGANVELRVMTVSPHEIMFHAAADEPSFAVIPQSWYPAWKVDYQGALPPSGKVFRANLAFQAVPIPKGESMIRLRYADNFFLVGAAVSVVSLLACVVILMLETKTLFSSLRRAVSESDSLS